MSGSLSLRPHAGVLRPGHGHHGRLAGDASRRAARWWLVPLTWVWACSHGMWFVGVVIGLVALVGLFPDGTVRGRAWLRLALVPLGSLAAAALTPVGSRAAAGSLGRGRDAPVRRRVALTVATDIDFVAFLVLGRRRPTHLVARAPSHSVDRDPARGLAIGFALLYVRTSPSAPRSSLRWPPWRSRACPPSARADRPTRGRPDAGAHGGGPRGRRAARAGARRPARRGVPTTWTAPSPRCPLAPCCATTTAAAAGSSGSIPTCVPPSTDA